MNNCIFSIVATNYIGLAQTLEQSVRFYNHNVDFYIIVADEPSLDVKEKFSENILVAKDILDFCEQKWYEMAFKYNLTEFCTSIKANAISYFFRQQYTKVAYFDPDILTFHSLEYIWDSLDVYDAILTPHILTPEVNYTGNLCESKLLFSGVYNMGFGAFKNTSSVNNFLLWWNKRLENYCFSDLYQNLFTDQKWVDMLPCFLGCQLLVSRHKGMNVAPWNFHERQIIKREGFYWVANRCYNDEVLDNLLFVHYSGYNYKSLLGGEIVQQNIENIKQYDDVICLFTAYCDALKNVNINEYISETYSYNFFSDRDYQINDIIRRLFRGYIENGNTVENPFDVTADFFRKMLKKGFVRKQSKFAIVRYNNENNKTTSTIHFVNCLFGLLFMLVGANRYYSVIRALRKYGILENHTFLITRKGEKYRLRRI